VAALIKRSVAPFLVIGATDEKQFLVPVDPKTLSLDKEMGIRTRSEHVHTALREFAGIGEHESSKLFPLKNGYTACLVRLER